MASRLVGHISFDGILTDVQQNKFLERLEILMREYRIVKVDVGYNVYFEEG